MRGVMGYSLGIYYPGTTVIQTPEKCHPIHVAPKEGSIWVWFEYNSDEPHMWIGPPDTPRRFRVVNDMEVIEANYAYVGSVHMPAPSGPYQYVNTYHVFLDISDDGSPK